MIKNKNRKIILITLLFMILSYAVYAELLDNDVEVEPETELTYYLNVSYDGIDKNGISSSDTSVSQINSGYLYVEDKIPEGLEFIGFIPSDDGSIGAVRRSNGDVCPGYVLDDTKEETTNDTICNSNGDCYYHGLHYTKSDNTVRFTVKDIKAGCELTVGIITKTPTIDDPNTEEVETRRDFYNTASATEGILTVFSNTVHAFMGDSTVSLYKVKYEYTGNIPSNAPTLPDENSYVSGSNVGIASPVNIEGYIFSGWSSDDVDINNGTFTMPSNDIVLKGSFEEKTKYKVTYKIDGDIPNGYVIPNEKQYYDGQTVNVDSLKEGDIFNGYKFLGWTTNDINITSDNDFVMENKNITITGKFEIIKYKVEYKFYDTVLPPDSDNYLPSIKEYVPGEKIKLGDVTSPEGYKFLGWYKEDKFVMPESDVVIYGEWKKVYGIFEPKIDIEIIDKKEEYNPGDKVNYRITITNPEDFDIKEVIVRENNSNMEFLENDNYKKESNNYVMIDSIKSKEKIYLYSSYIVKEDDSGIINNEVEIIGALADNKYELKDKEYKASVDFKIRDKNVKINNNTNSPVTLDNIYKYMIIFISAIVGFIIIVVIRKKIKN